MQFDRRTTAEVESTRNFTNRKPYRSAHLKAEARRTARKRNGTYVSGAGTLEHPPVT